MRFLHSLLFIYLGLTAALPAFGQSIETEFKIDAPAQWLELRKNAFNSFAISVEETTKSQRPNRVGTEVQNREIRSRYIQFTQEEFKYHENIPLSDSHPGIKVPFNRRHIKIHNPDQTFLISKDPGSDWVLLDVEDSPASYAFDEKSINRPWHRNQPTSALFSLSNALGQDPRLMVGMNSSLEGLVTGILGQDEGCFKDFHVSLDPVFGRIVAVKISRDSRDVPMRLRGQIASATFEGEMRFLADWKWVPIEMLTTSRTFDDKGKELGKTTRTLKADYDAKQIEDARKSGTDLVPQSVAITSKTEPTQSSDEAIYKFRRLGAREIESILAKKTLDDFGLKD